ncbi:hypothetical protein ACQZV8_19185 [Magnetococcales bacterium HHB-1]
MSINKIIPNRHPGDIHESSRHPTTTPHTTKGARKNTNTQTPKKSAWPLESYRLEITSPTSPLEVALKRVAQQEHLLTPFFSETKEELDLYTYSGQRQSSLPGARFRATLERNPHDPVVTDAWDQRSVYVSIAPQKKNLTTTHCKWVG